MIGNKHKIVHISLTSLTVPSNLGGTQIIIITRGIDEEGTLWEVQGEKWKKVLESPERREDEKIK